MNKTEYIAKVVYYYAKNKPKVGILTFDKSPQRFVVKDLNGKKSNAFPFSEIHCGDTYIIQDNDKQWKITQCEFTKDGKWKMLGSHIDQDNCDGTLILYVPNRRLMRPCDDFIDESFALEPFSDSFVDNYLIFKKI